MAYIPSSIYGVGVAECHLKLKLTKDVLMCFKGNFHPTIVILIILTAFISGFTAPDRTKVKIKDGIVYVNDSVYLMSGKCDKIKLSNKECYLSNLAGKEIIKVEWHSISQRQDNNSTTNVSWKRVVFLNEDPTLDESIEIDKGINGLIRILFDHNVVSPEGELVMDKVKEVVASYGNPFSYWNPAVYIRDMKIKKDEVSVNGKPYVNLDGCSRIRMGTNNAICHINNLDNERIISIRKENYVQWIDGERNVSNWYRVVFLGENKTVKMPADIKLLLQVLYANIAIDENGDLDPEGVDLILEKYGED